MSQLYMLIMTNISSQHPYIIYMILAQYSQDPPLNNSQIWPKYSHFKRGISNQRFAIINKKPTSKTIISGKNDENTKFQHFYFYMILAQILMKKQHILLQHSNYKTDISIQIFFFVNSKISLKLMKSDYNDKNINSTTPFIFT